MAPSAAPRFGSPEEADPDVERMLAFRDGDNDAFRCLVEGYQTRVHRFLVGRVGDANRAEDLTQEVFLRVFRARDGYRPTASFRGWLFTIAHRLALNELRAQRRRYRVFARWLPAGRSTARSGEGSSPEDFWNDAVDERAAGPLEIVEAAELEHTIGSVIARLPSNQRVALELVAGEQFSYAEVATVLGISVAAVRSLLVRARRVLRSELGRDVSRRPSLDQQEDES